MQSSDVKSKSAKYPLARQSIGRERASVRPGGYRWPELRVGREAAYGEAYEWDLFLNELGNENKRRGKAQVLGEVACHYVTDKEMRSMIFEKYPQTKEDISEAGMIYRQIAKSIVQYIGYAQKVADSVHREGVLGEHPELMGKTYPGFYNELIQQPRWQISELKLRSPEGGAIVGYDGNRYGLDLTLNRFLYEERNDIKNHLKKDLKLDTNLLRNDWEPHATIFFVQPHLRVDDISLRYRGLIPETIDFAGPKVFHEPAILLPRD